MRAARLLPRRPLPFARRIASQAAPPPGLLDVQAGIPPPAATTFADTGPAVAAVASSSELGYTPPDLALRLVEAVHTSADLPWWGAIASSAVLCRALLLPLAVHGTQLAARMQALRQPIAALQARHAGGDGAAMAAELQALYETHGVSPMRMLALPVVQLPVFLSFFFGLKRLAEARAAPNLPPTTGPSQKPS